MCAVRCALCCCLLDMQHADIGAFITAMKPKITLLISFFNKYATHQLPLLKASRLAHEANFHPIRDYERWYYVKIANQSQYLVCELSCMGKLSQNLFWPYWTKEGYKLVHAAGGYKAAIILAYSTLVFDRSKFGELVVICGLAYIFVVQRVPSNKLIQQKAKVLLPFFNRYPTYKTFTINLLL